MGLLIDGIFFLLKYSPTFFFFRFWSLCTKSLSTPLLLSSGYRSLRSNLPKNADETALQSKIEIVSDYLKNKIIGHIYSALKNVMRYSPTAMEDVITAIRDLCDAKCIELLPVLHEDENDAIKDDRGKISGVPDFPSILLKAYVSHPKSPPGRIVDQIPWKVSAITALTDIFRLSSSHDPSTNNLAVSSEAVIKIESESGNGSGSENGNGSENGGGGNITEISNSLHDDKEINKIDVINKNSENMRYLAAKDFTIEFIETVSYDMQLLYKAMGTVSDSDRKYIKMYFFSCRLVSLFYHSIACYHFLIILFLILLLFSTFIRAIT